MLIPDELDSLLLAPTMPKEPSSSMSSPRPRQLIDHHGKGDIGKHIHSLSSAKSPPVAQTQSPPASVACVESLDIAPSCSRSFSPVTSDDDDVPLLKVPSCAGRAHSSIRRSRSSAHTSVAEEHLYQMKLPTFAHEWLLPISALCDEPAVSIESGNKGSATITTKRSGSSQSFDLADRSHKSVHGPPSHKSALPPSRTASPSCRSRPSETPTLPCLARAESMSTSFCEPHPPSLGVDPCRSFVVDVSPLQANASHPVSGQQKFVSKGRVFITSLRQVNLDNVVGPVVPQCPPKKKQGRQRPKVLDE